MISTRQPIPPAIAEAAADWIVRRDGGAMSAEDERAFARWCGEPLHREALARLEKVWGLLDEQPDEALGGASGTALDEIAASFPSMPVLPPLRQERGPVRAGRAPRSVRPRRRFAAIGAIAAALVLAVLGTVQDWPMRLRADYVTAVGERRVIALADGSVVQLDSGSAIALDYTQARRGLRLLAGAALFEVAPDRGRPFTVEAEGGSVTALGTAFAIRDDGDHAAVTVTKHSVRVEGDGRAAVVGEGQRADFGRAVLSGLRAAEGDATAWTRGRLVVVDRPLGEVVAQIARYRRGYVTVSGPAAAIRVSGVYDLDHPLAAIDSIEASHGLSSLRLSDRFIVLRR